MDWRCLEKGNYRKARFKLRDLSNIVRFGIGAPNAGDRIWVCPDQLKVEAKGLFRHQTGLVVDWGISERHITLEVESSVKYKACYEHWVYGVSWESTGIYEFILKLIDGRGKPVDGCKNLKDIIGRYEKLDRLFFEVEKTRSFMTRDEIFEKRSGKEFGGIYVHLDKNGSLVFGGGGYHRLAIAKILSVPLIPAQIGIVHKSQISYFKKLKHQGD